MKQLPLPIGTSPLRVAEPDSLADLMPPSLARTVRTTFDRMEIAEEEIEAAKTRHPKEAGVIHGAFGLLCPTDPIRDLSDESFRFHCREILDRVARGQDVRPGTTAELLGFLADASQLAPPARVAALLYQELFGRLFPERLRAFLSDAGSMEPDLYERDQILELERELRARLFADRGVV